MTSKELAQILGISPSAVSFALNGKSGVSTETRNKILTAAAKYGMKVKIQQVSVKILPIFFIIASTVPFWLTPRFSLSLSKESSSVVLSPAGQSIP